MSEEKAEKPKKLFQFTVTVWDDGEIDSEMNEFRLNPSGRGRPGKWRLGANDFVRRIEEILGDYDRLAEEWNKALGKGAKQLLGLQLHANSGTSVPATTPVVAKNNKNSKNEEKEEVEDESEDDEFKDMDLGEFDNPKDKE